MPTLGNFASKRPNFGEFALKRANSAALDVGSIKSDVASHCPDTTLGKHPHQFLPVQRFKGQVLVVVVYNS